MANRTSFKPGHVSWNDGLTLTIEHRTKVRQKALEREAQRNRKVRVNGVVYPNLTRAANALGISARSVKNYALSSKAEHKHFELL